MTDPLDTTGGASAGHMLRAAREAKGLHIAVVAAAVKVPQRKLEALEGDRYDELPDITFARALALAVCRHLKVDPAPVLARLPQPGSEQAAQGLVHVSNGLASPYRDRSAAQQGASAAWMRRPVFWASGLVLLAALVLALLPDNLWVPSDPRAPAPAASAAAPEEPAASVAQPSFVPSQLASSPTSQGMPPSPAGSAPGGAPAALEAAPPSAGRSAVVRATASSWVQVRDAHGRVLLSRTLQPAESVDLDGPLPMRVIIGNARGTEVLFRGRPVNLAPVTGRDNVARLELK